MALQIRRGLLGELNTITPAEGEPVYTTDAKKVYIGDGVTQGGILVSAGQDVTTTSNVTFASVIVTNTATVGAIKFPDGSVQTTADTANPDQSLNTTSNVRFNSAVIATTATVTAIKFADGSVQTTADTANPDQSVNTTSNVVFTSVTVGHGAGPGNVYPWTGQNLVLGPTTGGRIALTPSEIALGTDQNTSAVGITSSTMSLNGIALTLADAPIKVAVSNTFTVKEANSDQNIIVATTASFKTFVNNAQALQIDKAGSSINFTLASFGDSAALSVFNDQPLTVGSLGNTYNAVLRTDALNIQRPSSLGGESRLLSFGANDITAWQNIVPHQDFAIGVGTTGTRFNSVVANKGIFYANSSTISATTPQWIIDLGTNGALTVQSGRGPQATSNFPNSNLLSLVAAGWNGHNHINSAQRVYSVAGAWANTLTSTVTNFGVGFSDSINVPNTRQPAFNEATAGYRGTWQQGTWNLATTRWPPQFELLEGFNVSSANLLGNVTNGANTTSTTGIQTVRFLINQEVRLLAPPSQDTTATAAIGFNKLRFVATRLSGAFGDRRSVASGDYLGEIYFNGVRAGVNNDVTGGDGCRIIGQANANYSSTNTHASLLFLTSVDGSTVPNQRLLLNGAESTFSSDLTVFKNAANSTEYFRVASNDNISSNRLVCETQLQVGGTAGAKFEVFTATNITSTATQQVGYFDTTGGLQHSAKFLVQAVDSGEIHFAEVSVISDGTDIWKVEYGTNTSAGALGTFSVAMNGALATLYFAPTAPTSMDIKTVLTVL